jgi:hypothetical protein
MTSNLLLYIVLKSYLKYNHNEQPNEYTHRATHHLFKKLLLYLCKVIALGTIN